MPSEACLYAEVRQYGSNYAEQLEAMSGSLDKYNGQQRPTRASPNT